MQQTTQSPNPSNNPVIAKLNEHRRARASAKAKGKAAAVTSKTAAEKREQDAAAMATNRKAMANMLTRRYDTIGEAVKHAVTAAEGFLTAKARVDVLATTELALSFRDVVAFMLHNGEGSANKDIPQLTPDANCHRQVIRFIRGRDEFRKLELVTDKDETGKVVTLERVQLAMALSQEAWNLAAKLAILSATPGSGVKLGYLAKMPAPKLLPSVVWQDSDGPKMTARAFCIERRKLFPFAEVRQVPESDPPVWEGVGEAKSTALKFLSADRVRLIWAKMYEHKSVAANLESINGNNPTGEIYLPNAPAKRKANAGTGNSAAKNSTQPLDLTDAITATQFKATVLNLAKLCRDGGKDDKQLAVLTGAHDIRAAVLRLASEMVAQMARSGSLSDRIVCDGAEGFEIVSLRNVLNSCVTDEHNGNHHVHDPSKAFERGRIIGTKGSGILPNGGTAEKKTAQAVA